MKNAPSKIWLQFHGDGEIDDYNEVDEKSVSWCEDKIFPNDIEYFSRQKVEAILQVFKAQIVVMLLDGAIDVNVDSIYEAYENIKQLLK